MLVRRKASVKAVVELLFGKISRMTWQKLHPSRRVLKVFVIATFESVAGLALADLSSWHGNDRETRATHVLRRQR